LRWRYQRTVVYVRLSPYDKVKPPALRVSCGLRFIPVNEHLINVQLGWGLFRLLVAIDNQNQLRNTLLVTLEPRATKRVL